MQGYEPPRARFRRRAAEELRLMAARVAALGTQDCFWVLETNRPDTDVDGARSAKQVRVRSASLALQAGGAAHAPVDPLPPDPSAGVSRERPTRRNRYVQCLFPAGAPWFLLDLPNCALDPAEAEVLLRERTGFARAVDRPALGYAPKTCRAHDPVVRQYLRGDEDEAADDLRYILFDLYGLPVTTPLFQTAAAFEGCRCWFERGVPFEDLVQPRPAGALGCPRCRG